MVTNTTTGSTTNRQKIRLCLRDFNFKALFVEELGWDILNEHPLIIPIEGATFVLRPLVEKRGVKVFVCDPDAEGRIPADSMLRKIEREVTRYAYVVLTLRSGGSKLEREISTQKGKGSCRRPNEPIRRNSS